MLALRGKSGKLGSTMTPLVLDVAFAALDQRRLRA